jgi:hypothetical protein
VGSTITNVLTSEPSSTNSTIGSSDAPVASVRMMAQLRKLPKR